MTLKPKKPGPQGEKPPVTKPPHDIILTDPKAHQAYVISGVQQKLKDKAINARAASAAIMDEVLPLWATAREPIENLETAQHILSKGPQDEFTERAVEVLGRHAKAVDQQELKEELRELVLERSVLNLFWSGKALYEEASTAVARLGADIKGGKNLKDTPITKVVEGSNQREYAKRNKALKKLMHAWGEAIGEPITPDELPVTNPAYSWFQLFTEDVVHNVGVIMVIDSFSYAIDRGIPIKEGQIRGVEEQLEKTPRELCAAGIILTKGSVLDKWGYYDPKSDSNYPKAIKRLNNGKDTTLEEVSKMVQQKYPRTSKPYTN